MDRLDVKNGIQFDFPEESRYIELPSHSKKSEFWKRISKDVLSPSETYLQFDKKWNFLVQYIKWIDSLSEDESFKVRTRFRK